jgi:plasmid stabilization system protein ParE
VKLRFSRRAEREVDRIDERWRAERPSAPTLFVDELASAVSLLRTSPDMGVPNRARRGQLVRRVLLEATRYHIYYVVDDEGIEVLTVWSALRGRGPRLGTPG